VCEISDCRAMCLDNPWNIEGSKMRFDSSQWYRRDSPEPRPVRGKSYLLLCETRGSPKPLPAIQWYRDGSPLHSSRHFYIIVSIRHSFTKSVALLAPATPQNHGHFAAMSFCLSLRLFVRLFVYLFGRINNASEQINEQTNRRIFFVLSIVVAFEISIFCHVSSVFLLLCKNTEWISMKFARDNHYHQPI